MASSSLQRADAIVIGAGIIGTSIAWRLAQAGMRVTVLEAGRVGGEASWAGAGMLAPGGEVEERTPWTDLALESLRLYARFIEELEGESESKIDFQQRGAVDIACNETELQALQARAEAQRVFGIRSAPLDSSRLRECIPLLERRVAGALFYPGDALVDPRGVMRCLKAACLQRNVRILEGHRATSICQLETVNISTQTEIFSADIAVLAAGAWSGEVVVRVRGTPQKIAETFPVKGHLVGYHMEVDSLRPILRHRHTYILQRAGGFTIAGTSSERAGFDRTVDAGIVKDIESRACELLPALRSAPEPEPWVGFRPATESLEPEVRRLPESNIWLAYGHYRNGILLAPITAREVSRAIIANSEKDWILRGEHR